MIIENKSKYLVQSMGTLSAPVDAQQETTPAVKKVNLNDYFSVNEVWYGFNIPSYFLSTPLYQYEFSEDLWNNIIDYNNDIKNNGRIDGCIGAEVGLNCKVTRVTEKEVEFSMRPIIELLMSSYGEVYNPPYSDYYIYKQNLYGFDLKTNSYRNQESDNELVIMEKDIFKLHKEGVIEGFYKNGVKLNYIYHPGDTHYSENIRVQGIYQDNENPVFDLILKLK